MTLRGKKKFYQREGFRTRLILFLVMIVVSLIIVVPYVWMLSNSFKSTKETLVDASHLLPKDPTLEGYRKVLFASPFFNWLRNSLIITVSDTVIILFTSTLLGYLFSRFEFRGKRFLFMMLLFTMMVPAQVTMITKFILIDRIGLYDNLLALIIPAVVSAFGVYLCRQYCDEIPRELLESARIDGASHFQIYIHIVIPQIRPAIGSLAIFTFLEIWNDYLNPLLYLSSTNKQTLPLALSFFSSQHQTDLSATMAASALIMIPASVVFIVFQKQFIKGIAMTGMKG